MNNPTQSPAPDTYLLHHRGDLITVSLTLPQSVPGKAWLRTNLGHAETRRHEVVRHVEEGDPLLRRDWHDIEMPEIVSGTFEIVLPLLEIGRFQAKAFFVAEESSEPVWPEGENLVIKVEPADYCCAATIYSAFVRQFGPNRKLGAESPTDAAAVAQLESAGYEVIPQSGKFRDLVAQLDHIVYDLGFRIIQLLPIFPTPTTYARMGRFGSPFAALDFMDVDRALASFDRRTTPLEQFRELLDETHHRGAKLFLDVPINHTGWASWLQNHHPEWFKRRDGDEFESPGAWGVTWDDLSELDYEDLELWRYMAEVFLFWCRQGVDGFRCDAGYMIPLPVWEYITAKVRTEFPDTAFLLEGLGGDKRVVFDLLDRANLNWAYSELFQNFDRTEVEAILRESIEVSSTKGLQIHFAETHDNNRLAATSHSHARMRTALAALCSHNGGFGINCGVEWFAKDKVEVHRGHGLAWGNEESQVAEIRRLNDILKTHPAFWAGATLKLIADDEVNVLALLRTAENGEEVLVLVNLDSESPNTAKWDEDAFPAQSDLWDLLTGELLPLDGGVLLEPGQSRCVCSDVSRLESLKTVSSHQTRSLEQQRRAKVLDIYRALRPEASTVVEDMPAEIEALSRDPADFCGRLASTGRPPVVHWKWPRDTRRTVLWLPNTLLLVECQHRFHIECRRGKQVLRRETSLPASNGGQFALLRLPDDTTPAERLSLHLKVFASEGPRHAVGELLVISDEAPTVMMEADKKATLHRRLYGLCTNGRGAMAHVQGNWGEIRSQYDALLAANPNTDYPVDRQMLLARLRGWLVFRDYSQEINTDCLQAFSQSGEGILRWSFLVPVGMGKHVPLSVELHLRPGKNAIVMVLKRNKASGDANALSDEHSVKLILRPDIEDRNFHEKTKASHGHEEAWPQSISVVEEGFDFQPSQSCGLQVRMLEGDFTHEPEWCYMVSHPTDAERGLDGASDLFSPGYFTYALASDAAVRLYAHVPGEAVDDQPIVSSAVAPLTLAEASKRAISDFIVKRDDTRTIIAGYPWFLDWGRDTLICLRGVIAAGMLGEARDIIRQFARFEKDGTLPNMIRGNDDSNRDTSDAPLWLFAACADLRRVDGDDAFLDTDCGSGRTIHEVLQSIAQGYLQGTPNGIHVDAASALVFSPSHFTWMDTNHPAGTPRVGYPIEIQALWHAALTLLDTLKPGEKWGLLRDQVAESIKKLFWHNERGFLSDCLHARPGQTAAQAAADDHLRPNQLFAITLGAISDPMIGRAVIASCEELLIPGAIRSLSERRVWHRLPVEREGQLLNDPKNPYWGRYEGDEDTRRKPAYHNGTAWTWPFPSYAEALVQLYGNEAKQEAKAILASSAELFNHGCLGHLPEVLDGDAPHEQRGCGAQAWGVTELYRVLALLDN